LLTHESKHPIKYQEKLVGLRYWNISAIVHMGIL
jgi:hypothetical protein